GATAAAPVAALPAPAVAHDNDPQLSLGEPLNDLSEHDLRDLAAVVNQLDAMPSDDVDSPVSSFNEGES
ncbi:MAG TPA: hypothetical protein VJ867_08220, partial [Gemmatimonadaceae bacterium]|nr:hypothetical protein [Gemmatimonadaceae bacterium]